MFQFNFTQLVSNPTHICGNVLDLVFTNCEKRITSLNVDCDRTSNIISSDHYPITLNLAVNVSQYQCNQTFYKYNYAKGDYNSLNQYLSQFDVSTFCQLTDIDQAWNMLKSYLQAGMEQFIPKFKSKSFKYPQWFTPDIRHRIQGRSYSEANEATASVKFYFPQKGPRFSCKRSAF